jgi:hypothetical protein
MSQLIALRHEIRVFYQKETCPTLDEQRDLVQRMVMYCKEQRTHIERLNALIKQTEEAFKDVHVESELRHLLPRNASHCETMKDVLEMVFCRELFDFLLDISQTQWRFYQKPWYKRWTRWHEFNMVDDFRKEEYPRLKEMWDECTTPITPDQE